MNNIPSFVAYIEETIVKNWKRDAFTDYKGDTLRYSDVARRIAKLHIGMETAGLKPGDKVAICGRNSANWAVAFFSILSYGCVVVPIQCEFSAASVKSDCTMPNLRRWQRRASSATSTRLKLQSRI